MRALLLFCLAYTNLVHSAQIPCVQRVEEQSFRQRLLAAAVEAFTTVPQEDFAPLLFVATEAVEEMQSLGLEGFVQQMKGWDLKVTEQEVRWLERIMNASHRHAKVEAFGVSHPRAEGTIVHTIPDASLKRLLVSVLCVPLLLPRAIDEFLRGRRYLFDPFAADATAAAALLGSQMAEWWSCESTKLNVLFGSKPELLGELTAGLTTIRNAMRAPEFRAAMIPYQQLRHQGRFVAEVRNHLFDGWNIVQEQVGARPGDATLLRALMDSVEQRLVGLYISGSTTRPSFIETAQE